MKSNILYLATAAIGLCLGACSSDNTQDPVPGEITDNGEPAGFTLSISEPITREGDTNATAEETRFVTADIFIYAKDQISKHVRLDRSDFELTGSHVYTTENPILTTTGEKEIYVGLNLPVGLGQAIAAQKNKSGLYLLGNTGTYPLASMDSDKGFVMFSTEPAIETLKADFDNIVTAKVGRLVAKVTVVTDPSISISFDEGDFDDFTFAMRNVNKLFWPYQKKAGVIVYDPNYYSSEYNSGDFEHAAANEYIDVDQYDANVLPGKVKYVPENTSEETQQRETTYASVRATFMPKQFTPADGDLYDNTHTEPVDFYVVKLQETGEAYYFEKFADAEKFAEDKGTISDLYEDGYCYYNLFVNPTENFQTLRNNFYTMRITSVAGLGNPNPEDDGNTTEPVTRPAQLDIEVDIQKWTVHLDDYPLY